MRGNRFWGWVAVLAIFGLASCGEDQVDEQGPREVVGSYQAAFLDGDFETACELLTGESAREFIADTDLGDEDQSCPAALERLDEIAGGDEIALLEEAYESLGEAVVRAQGRVASVDSPRSAAFRLERVGGRWYIADTNAELPLLPTAPELKACLEDQRDYFDLKIRTDVLGADGERVSSVTGVGPTGDYFGVLLAKDHSITEGVAEELAKDFETRSIDGRVLIFGDGNKGDEDVAEGCVSGSE